MDAFHDHTTVDNTTTGVVCSSGQTNSNLHAPPRMQHAAAGVTVPHTDTHIGPTASSSSTGSRSRSQSKTWKAECNVALIEDIPSLPLPLKLSHPVGLTNCSNSEYGVIETPSGALDKKITNQDMMNQDMMNQDMMKQDMMNPDTVNQDMMKQDMMNQDPDIMNQDMMNQDVKRAGDKTGERERRAQGEQARVPVEVFQPTIALPDPDVTDAATAVSLPHDTQWDELLAELRYACCVRYGMHARMYLYTSVFVCSRHACTHVSVHWCVCM